MALPNAYVAGRNGRSMIKLPEVRQGALRTTVTCSRCGDQRAHDCPMGSEQLLDNNFSRRGWSMGRKPVCPACQSKPKEKPVASTPSPNAVKAQVALVNLLSLHFDVAAGAFAPTWDDARVARETGLAPDYVAQFRRDGFGDLREPSEVAALRADIAALETLHRETEAQFAQSLAELKSKLAKIAGKFAA